MLPYFQDILTKLNQVPDWVGTALTGAAGWIFIAICTSIGWFFRILWEALKRHSLPFDTDKARFDWVMSTVIGDDILYFQLAENYTGIAAHRSNSIFNAADAMTFDTKAGFLNKKLKAKEDALRKGINELAECISVEAAPHRTVANVYTIRVIDYDSSNPRHLKLYRESEKKILTAAKSAMSAYEQFRDYGTRYFAVKITPRINN